jgi:hypothetical protein
MTLLGVLGVIFIVLKLVGVIFWSWWLVLLPFYGGFLIWLILVLIGAVFVGAAAASPNFTITRNGEYK